MEAIFEFHWGNPLGNDPNFHIFAGLLHQKIIKRYPNFRNALPNLPIPLPEEVLRNCIYYQFRQHDEMWPLEAI